MRMLSQSRVDEHADGSALLEWRFTPGSNPNAAADREAGGETVRFNFRLVNGANPLSLSGFRRLGLPEKITNKGV